MKLIGLAGAAGSGKDTVAEMIHDHAHAASSAFANPLKVAAQAIFGLTHEQMTRRDLKEKVIPYWGRSPRQIMQLLGTECIREQFGRDTWLKRAALWVQELAAGDRQPEVVVFTDVRFADEAQWIVDQGGVVVEIIRPGVQAVAAHSSEQGIPEWLVDFGVLNDGSLEDLRRKVAAGLPMWLENATMVRREA